MRNLRWWAPLATAAVALGSGIAPYIALNNSGKIPASIRDNPWPMELVAIAATIATIVLTVEAYRQKRVRIVATLSAALATLATGVFLLLVHVASYQIPGESKEVALGSVAPDFVLSDAQGQSFSLASMRGKPVLLVFYRGVW